MQRLLQENQKADSQRLYDDEYYNVNVPINDGSSDQNRQTKKKKAINNSGGDIGTQQQSSQTSTLNTSERIHPKTLRPSSFSLPIKAKLKRKQGHEKEEHQIMKSPVNEKRESSKAPSISSDTTLKPKKEKSSISPPTPDAVPSEQDKQSKAPLITTTCTGATPPAKGKKLKEFRPFRPKKGCLVAIRYKPLGEGTIQMKVIHSSTGKRTTAKDVKHHDTVNKERILLDPWKPPMMMPKDGSSIKKEEENDNDTPPPPNVRYSELWLEPITGRDDGLALIGKMIRCLFPKSTIQDSQSNLPLEKRPDSTKSRTLQGIVIQNLSCLANSSTSDSARGLGLGGTKVRLLVDSTAIQDMPFLRVCNQDMEDGEGLSKGERKRREYERIIRGKDKMEVEVVLANICDMGLLSLPKYKEEGFNYVPPRWRIRKQIPIADRGSNKKAAINRFIGDHNDIDSQQERNWKWIAAKGIKDTAMLNLPLFGEILEMGRGDPSTVGATLSMVSLRQIVLPECTKRGRLSCHHIDEAFDVDETELIYQVPVENLIVISRKIERNGVSGKGGRGESEHRITDSMRIRQACIPCIESEFNEMNNIFVGKNMVKSENTGHEIAFSGPKSKSSCLNWQNALDFTPSIDYTSLSLTQHIFNMASRTSFDLPTSFMSTPPLPKTSPYTLSDLKEKPLKNASTVKSNKSKKLTGKKNRVKKVKLKKEDCGGSIVGEGEIDERTFKSTCSRTEIYDHGNKPARTTNNSANHALTSLLSMRRGGRKAQDDPKKDNQSNVRATRANQRRMLKDTTIFGHGVKDKLTGREANLRFGKSLIHGWGCFTDEIIDAGDFIVEYRGILIGNAVADKREKEYEAAKIGSDYMFRIDSGLVCDATHQGCVARFINASCSPNCYTQIIVINGVKRIAIYARREIQPGEELSYDYKFEPEFNETKRIRK